MLNFKFNKKLVSTRELLGELGLSLPWLDNKKNRWRKRGFDCWDMGLRLIGNSALWDPIVFLNWLSENKLKNLPKELREQRIVAFVSRNSSEQS